MEILPAVWGEVVKHLIIETLRANGRMPRSELVKRIAESDRTIRKVIAEECPCIGEAGDGYYYKRTTEDCLAHENHIKARIMKLAERYRRCVEYRLDLQHGRTVSEIVRNWHVYNGEELRIKRKIS